jgi:predicted aldo/keto reductase-like oxidoreductase
MKSRRDEVFLATKINNRSAGKVLDELKQSLEKLQTDRVDLIQVHAVNAWADLEQALAPDGALEALAEARSQGLVQYIGITGHARPDILAEGLKRYPFDTVLVALGIADKLVSAPHLTVLPTAMERGVGVIAMKTLGHGCYERREMALRFSLGLEGVSLAIVGMKNEEEIREVVTHAERFTPLTEAEEERLIDNVRPLIERDVEESKKKGESSLFWLHDTTVMGWSQKDEPALVSY